MFSFREVVNHELLKDIVKDHKLIDVYVEIGKTRLDLYEMSPLSIKTVFWEMDEQSRKVASVVIQSCCRRLVLDDLDNEPVLEPFMQLTQVPMDVDYLGESSQLPKIEPVFSTLDMSFFSQPVDNSEGALVLIDKDNSFQDPDNLRLICSE